MKFIYVDESGGTSTQQSDVFVMFGFMVDAYRLRKTTSKFDHLLHEIYHQNTSWVKAANKQNLADFKTNAFINGKRGWSSITLDKRKKFLEEICKLIIEKGKGHKIFGIALSFKSFNAAVSANHGYPFKKDFWVGAAMFIACLIQRNNRDIKDNKGHTVVIIDDNPRKMAKLSQQLYEGNNWFLKLCKKPSSKKNFGQRQQITTDQFDQIINTPFGINSKHSSLIQVSDMICYIYRRHLELQSISRREKWPNERKYFADLVAVLEPHRQKFGRSINEPCYNFYQAARNPEWNL